MPTAISSRIARNRLGALLKATAGKKGRLVITRGGKPIAVLLSVSDFDDMLEELDPEFRNGLKTAREEHRAGKSVLLDEYVTRRLSAHRAG